jgi:hypothetical protein
MKGHNWGLCTKCGKIHEAHPCWGKNRRGIGGIKKGTHLNLSFIERGRRRLRMVHLNKTTNATMDKRNKAKVALKQRYRENPELLEKFKEAAARGRAKIASLGGPISILKNTDPSKYSKFCEKAKVVHKGTNKGEANPMFGKVSYPKLEFDPSLGHSIRSSYEKEIGRMLKSCDIKYVYEGKRFFIKSTNSTYTPDFIIFQEKVAIEAKGPLFDFQLLKMLKFLEEYPAWSLILVGADRYKNIPTHERLFHIKWSDRSKVIDVIKGRRRMVNEVLNWM